MTRPHRTRATPAAIIGTVITAALASFAPAPAVAADYDVDCKLILCLPAGFPSGCGDAMNRMVDRLRDGKSPIGFCALSDGTEYDRYDIDYSVISARSDRGWKCPVGKTLFHDVRRDEDQWNVTTFCYSSSHTQTSWSSDGSETRTIYTDRTIPERTDFRVKIVVEPDTAGSYTPGWQTFDANIARDLRTTVRYF